MLLRPPRTTLTDPLFPDTTLVRSQEAGCRAADPIGIVAGMAFVVFGASLDRPGAVAAFCHFDNGYANGREGQGLLFGRSGCGIIATGHQNIIVGQRSEEHTSELQSLMRISYAVFCLKKKNTTEQQT